MRTRSGSLRPTSASAPSANAVSVDMAMPQACSVGRPAFVIRKMATGTTIPARPTSSGSVSLLRTRSSPTSNSRRASSPTTRKKNAISPEFTNSCRLRPSPEPPTSTDSRVPQNRS